MSQMTKRFSISRRQTSVEISFLFISDWNITLFDTCDYERFDTNDINSKWNHMKVDDLGRCVRLHQWQVSQSFDKLQANSHRSMQTRPRRVDLPAIQMIMKTIGLRLTWPVRHNPADDGVASAHWCLDHSSVSEDTNPLAGAQEARGHGRQLTGSQDTGTVIHRDTDVSVVRTLVIHNTPAVQTNTYQPWWRDEPIRFVILGCFIVNEIQENKDPRQQVWLQVREELRSAPCGLLGTNTH